MHNNLYLPDCGLWEHFWNIVLTVSNELPLHKDRGANFGLGGGAKSNRESERVWGRCPQKNFL